MLGIGFKGMSSHAAARSSSSLLGEPTTPTKSEADVCQMSPQSEQKTRLSRRFNEMMETEDTVASSINDLIAQLVEVGKVSPPCV